MVKCCFVGAVAAIQVVGRRAAAERRCAEERWAEAIGPSAGTLGRAAVRFLQAGRITLNFHPDRVGRHGTTVAPGRPDGVVDAHAIGRRATKLPFTEPIVAGDTPDSDLQQLKYLWHTLLACGKDAAAT